MPGKLHRSAIALLAAALLCLGSCTAPSDNARAASLKPEAERQNAPDFALKDANGRTVRLSDYRGKAVLLNFWATWCGPCRLEIPSLVQMEQKYRDKGFAVIGISMDEDGWEVINPFVSEFGVNYRMVLGTELVAELFGSVDSLPTSFLIDRNGKVASAHVGLISEDILENDIEEIL